MFTGVILPSGVELKEIIDLSIIDLLFLVQNCQMFKLKNSVRDFLTFHRQNY